MVINIQKINIKTKLALKKPAKKVVKKTIIMAK